MAVYLTTMFLSYCLAYLGRLYAGSYRRPLLFFAWGVAILLVLVAGLRSSRGDTFSYIISFTTNIDATSLENTMAAKAYEPGFLLYMWLIKSLWDNWQVFLFLSSLITLVSFVFVYRRYSPYFELSIYLFIASDTFGITMNGLRQYLASAILFAGFPLIAKNRWLQYFLLLVLAASIHKSALILIIVYFILRSPAWTRNTWLLLIASVILIYAANSVLPTINAMAELAGYSVIHLGERGANIMRSVIAAIPCVLAFKYRVPLRIRYQTISDVVVNASLFNAFFYLIAVLDANISRLCFFFVPFTWLLIPMTIAVMPKRWNVIVYGAFMLFYLAYFIFNANNLMLVYTSNILKF